ncbi:MBL fold metallo-hydrolase [Pelobacter propionicus]|uniref:Beta-lactamase domain protein n=1 Tax=Pelobacter propionicus (strain DSM 2379 / NBRC 103807 / OttBd1) TaxID=338966 RepID=A1AQD4_PELPD|nr:MBL fold metallo-hydrolase [Pelobacter propionicus]ABK99554.1 beta-lactamase domain protein [Pelobacter propionicus DSM 2379]
MAICLTILCENSVAKPFGLLGEHGFACFLETPQGSYLFDTGQGRTLVPNARYLGKELGSIRALLISHGHYDHTGALPQVLECCQGLDVLGHPDLFLSRYWELEGKRRFLGIPHRREYLESLGARFRLSRELTEIGPGVWLTGEIPRCSPWEKGDASQVAVTETGEILRPDPVNDDLSMVVETPAGLVLVLGCAHAGLVNIIDYVTETFAGKRIHAVIGGTHLGFAGEEQFEKTLGVLERLGIEKVGVSHCTGLYGSARIAARLGERFFFAAVGTVLEF